MHISEESMRITLVPYLRRHPNQASVKDTPGRFLRYLDEFSREFSPRDVLSKAFECPSRQMIIQVGIPVVGVCEHHLLPFIGTCSIGYIPSGAVVGLSKLTRLVEGLCHQRPTIQEVVTDAIVDALIEHINPRPKGAVAVISAEHTCMTARGVQAPGVQSVTSAVRGVFKEDGPAKAEFLQLIHGHI